MVSAAGSPWLVLLTVAHLSCGSAWAQPDETETAEETETRSFEWAPQSFDGQTYVSDEQAFEFYQFESFERNERSVSFVHPGMSMAWRTPDPSAILFNGVRVSLTLSLLEKEGQVWISSFDIARVLDPVLRPGKIDPGAREVARVVVDPVIQETEEGSSGGIEESNLLVLRLAEALDRELRTLGYETVLTRRRGQKGAVANLEEVVNRERGGVFVRVGFSSEEASSETAFTTAALTPRGNPQSQEGVPDPAWKPGNSQDGLNIALAVAVQSHLLAYAWAEDGGVVRSDSEALGRLEVPGIEVRLGSLSNRKHTERLGDADSLRQLALGIATGVRAYEFATLGRGREESSASPEE